MKIKEKLQKKETRDILIAVLAVILFYAFLFCMGITCPIKYVTGISCAGCGMTRAWLSALRLDLKGALYYHPLFWMLPPAAVLLLVKNRLNHRVYSLCLYTIAGLFVIVYLYRLIWGDGEIVVFEPYNNILFRGIRQLM